MAEIPCAPLTLIQLLNAVKNCRLDLIEEPLKVYGLPKNGLRINDYLILRKALETNYREIAKCLINAGCRVKPVPFDKGLTPLALAIANEDQEIALMIMKKGATLHIANGSKTSILHFAAARKSLKMLKFVFICNIDVNLLDGNGKTALQILLEYCNTSKSNSEIEETNKIEMIRFLLLRGASVDFRSSDGKTALHHIISLKQEGITKFVLQKSKDVNLCDNRGRTALHYLMSCDHESEHDVIELVNLFIEKGVKIDIADYRGFTVTHIAAEKKYFKIINMFIQLQCKVILQLDNKRNTILHRLLENSAHLCNDEIFTDCVNSILSRASLENNRNSDGKTPLHLAAENHHYGILEKMLPKFMNVNISDKSGETLLHILVKDLNKVNYNIIRRLLNAGANIGMKNASGTTPLDVVLKAVNTELFFIMVLQSKNFNQYNFHSNSVLHYLSDLKVSSPTEELKIVEIARTCIVKGAHVDAIDNSLRTPLLAAILNQRKSMVELLLKHGANVDFNKLEDPVIKYLITKSSLSSVDLEIAEMLVCKGSRVKAITLQGLLSLLKHNSHGARLLVTKLLDNCKNIKVRDSSVNTLLHNFLDSVINTKDACEEEFVKIVRLLLKKGIQVDAKNKQGKTALHLAAKNKHNLVSELLLKNGADVALLDNAGNSVLHFVSMLNVETEVDVEKNMIDLFVARGCDINARNISDMTPLVTAVQFGCTNVIKALISDGADIERAAGDDISSILHIAVEYGSPAAFIEHLLKSGANVYDKRKDNGVTCLHVAAAHGRLDTLMVLLKNRVYPDVTDCSGRTALHWACMSEKLDVVILLLSMGADVNAMDNLKITPLMLAQESNDALWATLVGHVKRLEVAGVDIVWQNTNCINNGEEQVDTARLESAARLEVSKMQKKMIDNNYSLADVVKMKLHKSDIFRDNSAFKKFVMAKDFEKEFPCYSYVIKACFLRGAVRNYLVKETRKRLSLSRLALPDICAENIFKFLDNESLINLSQATKLKVSGMNIAGSGMK